MSHHHDTFDDTISILDPRRFTPTLHANLVAEILSLRRDLESKANLIDTLEHDLSAARSEHETATTSAATAQREARDVKRQLERAENDDSVEVVAKERDEAVEAIAELKRQVERLTKSRRSAEEDLERAKTIAERDNEGFQASKRALERRAHVAEGRLKALLDELSAANAMSPPPPPVQNSSESEGDDAAPSEVAMSDTASIRTSFQGRPSSVLMGDDVAERLGIRFSMLNGGSQGLSLADELDLDGEEYDEIQEEEGEEEEEDEGDRTETEAEGTGDNASDSDSDTEDEAIATPRPEPEYCEMGTQVDAEDEEEEAERPEILLLEESRAALERTYAELDRKTAELASTYTELGKAHERIGELEEQLDGLAEEVAEKKRVLVDQEIDHGHKIKLFEAQAKEVEERWTVVETKENSLSERERSLSERLNSLDTKERLLEEREAIITALPDSPVDTEHAFEPVCEEDNVPSDSNSRACEGEYEANQRRKRSSGVVSPPPHQPAPSIPIYESVETQTDSIEERPPTPPPKSPIRPPRIQTQTSGTQTDPLKPPALRIIPTIAVTPPPPTPPLPGQPPANMRNASVQTRAVRSKTRSVQTDEIAFEQRMLRLPARLLPAAILANNHVPPPPSVTAPAQPERPPPSPPKKSSKRLMKRISTSGQGMPTSAPRPIAPALDSPGPPGHAIIYSPPRIALEYEGGSERRGGEGARRQLFNGIDLSHDLPQSSGDDDFHDDAEMSENEFKTALSAPRPKRPRSHVNPGRPSPVAENPDSPHYEAYSKKPANNIRRNALVTSGVQAHNRARSPSLTSNRTSESGGKVGPPFPVPIRHSSRKPTGYASSRNESPTPVSAGLPRRTLPARRQSIRKVRSAAALPTLRTSNHRNRSPPPLSASSAAPDSPLLPPLPKDEVLSPAFEKQKFGSSRHKHQASNNTSNTGNASIGSSIHQISVVDAIAQTMVGEWMWKYVRRRRSFGVPESPQAWDGRDESTSGGGQRHKRWVWLAPYERAVMWSSRQPTSGNALLGKSGRKRKRSILQPPAGLSVVLDKVLMNKVPIQSVLDVKDDTPLPKGANPAQPLFNRSILILTPARALKFTAPNRERHYVWLTALSFLSHSAHESEGLLALPPPMPFEYDQMQQQRPQSPVTVRAVPPIPPIPPHRDPPFHPIRDSIRVAKGKSRAAKSETNGYTNTGSLGKSAVREIDRHSILTNGDSIAEPPTIPRFPGHSRKRSNNMMRPGTNRSISHGYNPSLHSSFGGSSNGDYYPTVGVGGIGLVSGNSSISHGVPGHALGGWDTGPMGTVRMEAFVDPKPRFEFDEEDEYRGNKPSSYRLRRDRRSSRQESYWSGSGDFYGAGSVKGSSVVSGSIDDGPDRDDPFRGF